MKNINTVTKLICLLALLSFASSALYAQSFIKENHHLFADKTMVRHISDTSWIVYTEAPNNCSFSKIQKVSNTTPIMRLNTRAITINDFEIVGGIAYFCGMTTTIPSKAVIGVFNTVSFPGSVVYLAEVPSFLSFDKMELLATGEFLMIGKDVNSQYHFIQVIETLPLTWNLYIYDQIPQLIDKIDDVAANNQYAVFTGRNTSLNRGYVFFIDYSTTGFINSQPIQILECSYNVRHPLLLEYCESNAFCTATMGNDSLLYVSAYLGPTHLSTQRLITGYRASELADLRYKKSNSRLDVLINQPDYENFYSLILHMESNLINTGVGSATAHLSTNYWLSSLGDSPDYVPGGSGMMVASGFGNLGLSFHRYHANVFSCWEKLILHASDVENNNRPFERILERNHIKAIPEILPTYVLIEDLVKPCHQKE